MKFEERINNLIDGKKSLDKVYENINFICVYEFKWSYHELMSTPIPFVLTTIDKWNEMKKAEKKALKRR
jgi:hypothetical protein